MSTVDVVVVAGGKPANFCDLGGGGSAEGVVDALEVITRDPQVTLDLLQHLRRHHPLRRGRARHSRGAHSGSRSTCRSSSGSTARTRRRAGRSSPTPRPAQPARRADDARCGAARRWSSRHERRLERARRGVPHERRSTRRATTSTSWSSWCEPARRRDRRSTSRPAAAMSRAVCASGGAGRHVDPGARDAGRRHLRRRGSPVCRRRASTSSSRRSRPSLRRRRASRPRDGARRQATVVVIVATTHSSARVEAAERLRDPTHVRNCPSDRVARPTSSAPGWRIDESSTSLDAPARVEPWLARTDCVGDDAERVRELLGDVPTDGSDWHRHHARPEGRQGAS